MFVTLLTHVDVIAFKYNKVIYKNKVLMLY